MNIIKFQCRPASGGTRFVRILGESLRQDHHRLYTLQSRLAVLRIRRRVRGIRDRGQVQTLLRMCRLTRATLRQTHTKATAHARALRASVGGLV